MSLFRLPRGKFPLTFLAVPAGKDCRVECPCQTFDGFIGIRGKICGFFLLVQTHTPLIVPLRQRRAGKSGFHFISGARARKLSAMHLLSVDSLMAYRCLPLCGLFRFFNGFRKNLLHAHQQGILPLLPVRPHHANLRSSFSSRSCNPSQYFRSSFSVCGSGSTEQSR